MYFVAAKDAIDSIRLVVDADYVLPIFIFFFITFVGFLTAFTTYDQPSLFETASVLLGGLKERMPADEFRDYQMQTFCVVCLAFIGSYVYSLGRILDRVNNNDLYPISLYYYTVRTVIACISAAVLRHTIGVVADGLDTVLPWKIGAESSPLLLLMGFTIGFAPDLFILAMVRKGFQALKIWGTRNDPDAKTRPTSLALLMIDDMTREKIDRLNELGIDSAQMLARQNPYLLLPRLPYDLGMLVDWISQAQLYTVVKDQGLSDVRARCVRDIFDLQVRLKDDQARGPICAKLELSSEEGAALSRQLDDDPSYLRLREVREALKPPAKSTPTRNP